MSPVLSAMGPESFALSNRGKTNFFGDFPRRGCCHLKRASKCAFCTQILALDALGGWKDVMSSWLYSGHNLTRFNVTLCRMANWLAGTMKCFKIKSIIFATLLSCQMILFDPESCPLPLTNTLVRPIMVASLSTLRGSAALCCVVVGQDNLDWCLSKVDTVYEFSRTKTPPPSFLLREQNTWL